MHYQSNVLVVINGALEGYFTVAKGLRQWDPIAMLIPISHGSFLLSASVQHRKWELQIASLVSSSADPSHSHMIFANDLFILSSAQEESFQIIKRFLTDIQNYSGLQPNLLKSSIFRF